MLPERAHVPSPWLLERQETILRHISLSCVVSAADELGYSLQQRNKRIASPTRWPQRTPFSAARDSQSARCSAAPLFYPVLEAPTVSRRPHTNDRTISFRRAQ